MNKLERESTSNETKHKPYKVRIKEVDNAGVIKNFWQSDKGWVENDDNLLYFIKYIEKGNNLRLEECAEESKNGNCENWIDMTKSVSPRILEFKKFLRENIEREWKSMIEIKKLVKVEVYDKKTKAILACITTDELEESDAHRLFLDFPENNIGIRISNRQNEDKNFNRVELNEVNSSVLPFLRTLSYNIRELKRTREPKPPTN